VTTCGHTALVILLRFSTRAGKADHDLIRFFICTSEYMHPLAAVAQNGCEHGMNFVFRTWALLPWIWVIRSNEYAFVE
jgi:hypothetical protein